MLTIILVMTMTMMTGHHLRQPPPQWRLLLQIGRTMNIKHILLPGFQKCLTPGCIHEMVQHEMVHYGVNNEYDPKTGRLSLKSSMTESFCVSLAHSRLFSVIVMMSG